jgi:hypothetical protein
MQSVNRHVSKQMSDWVRSSKKEVERRQSPVPSTQLVKENEEKESQNGKAPTIPQLCRAHIKFTR